jgi:hypothetical protein
VYSASTLEQTLVPLPETVADDDLVEIMMEIPALA